MPLHTEVIINNYPRFFMIELVGGSALSIPVKVSDPFPKYRSDHSIDNNNIH